MGGKTTSSKRKRSRKKIVDAYKKCAPYWCPGCRKLVIFKPCKVCEYQFVMKMHEKRRLLARRLADPDDDQLNELAQRLFGKSE